MFKNYIKIAFRNILKTKSISLINLLGITIGLVSSLIIFLYVFYETSYDSFHNKKDRIFKILSIDEAIGVSSSMVGMTIPALAETMKKEIPEVEEVVRIIDGGETLIRYEDRFLYAENYFYTSPSFLNIFDFEIKEGNPKTCLNSPYTAVLTESMAQKIFGEENPIGKTFSADGNENIEVTGIIKDSNKSSHINIDVIVSINPSPSDTSIIDYLNSWHSIGVIEYALLTDEKHQEKVINEIERTLRKNNVRPAWKATLQPLKDVHLKSEEILFDEFNKNKGNINYVRYLTLVAIVILLIASFNYMNLSTARSSKRAREVGVRKTVGARKKQLIIQHLLESVILIFISMVLSLGIVEVINNIFHVVNQALFQFIGLSPQFIVYLLLIVIVLGLISGVYPAFIMSGFKPHIVLKGKFETGKQGVLLKKILVGMQFVATFIMIVGVIIIVKQLDYTLKKDKGFDQSNIINITLNPQNTRSNFDAFKKEVEKTPGVQACATSSSMPGIGFGRVGVLPEGVSEEEDSWIVSMFVIDENYIPLMKMEFVEGENFRERMSRDILPVIVNESFVRSMGWKNGLNKTFRSHRWQAKVIGVIKDFHFTSLRHKIEPLFMIYRPGFNHILSIKLSPNNRTKTVKSIEKLWSQMYEGIPFNYDFYDETFSQLFKKEKSFSKMFFSFTLLSIIVAILGLFGLAAYSAEQRTKEIGIRKTFGASIKQLVVLQSNEYLRLIMLAILVAAPIAYYILKKWLQGFEYKINMSINVYFAAALIIILVTILTVGFHAFNSARKNPADTLRYE